MVFARSPANGWRAARALFGAPTPATPPQPYCIHSPSESPIAGDSSSSGPLTVITGPPGTGKSQVIAIKRRGRSVLLAARHRAIDAVQERLEALTEDRACSYVGKRVRGVREVHIRRWVTCPPGPCGRPGRGSAFRWIEVAQTDTKRWDLLEKWRRLAAMGEKEGRVLAGKARGNGWMIGSSSIWVAVQAELAPHGRGPGWGTIGASRNRIDTLRVLEAIQQSDPDDTIRQALTSALSELVGNTDLAVFAVPDTPAHGEAFRDRNCCCGEIAADPPEACAGCRVAILSLMADGIHLAVLSLEKERHGSDWLLVPERSKPGQRIGASFQGRGSSRNPACLDVALAVRGRGADAPGACSSA